MILGFSLRGGGKNLCTSFVHSLSCLLLAVPENIENVLV